MRRGAYRAPGDLSPEAEHRLLISATTALLKPGAVVSHASAAVLHGLPVPRRLLARVHVTRERCGGHVTRHLFERGQRLPPSHVDAAAGVAVTTPARTVVDLARTLPFDWALAVADAGLTRGVRVEELEGVLSELPRGVGNPQARAVLRLADARSESVGESRSRALFIRAGLPMPTLQYEVWGHGVLLGRADFAWEASWVLGEFDGAVKYGRLVRPGESPQAALVREKVREDALRAEGWLVLRWMWADLDRPDALLARICRALGVR